MSFIRNEWPLKHFKGKSQLYVFPSGNGHVEDYDDDYKHKQSLIELIANFIYRCTKDEEYVWKMVKTLAKDYGIEDSLRERTIVHE